MYHSNSVVLFKDEYYIDNMIEYEYYNNSAVASLKRLDFGLVPLSN